MRVIVDISTIQSSNIISDRLKV